MSGSHPTPNADGQPAGASREGDPSMEDILASIRRILSEEENAEAAAGNAAEEKEPDPAGEPEEEDVLVLDSSMIVSEREAATPAPSPAPAAAAPAMAQPEPEPVPVAVPPPTAAPSTETPAAASPAAASLLAPEAAAAALTAMSDLVRTLAAERSTQVHRGGPTIEDLVREEIRPLLKTWLDTNLPPIVERLVRAELERVVNRAVP